LAEVSSLIDTHVHIVAPDHERYPFHPDSRGLGRWVTEHPVSVEELILEMSIARVDQALLVQASSAYGYDNSYVADSAEQHPTRFVAVCIIDMLAPDAPETLTHLVDQRGMRGIRLFTTPEPEAPWLDDPRTFPVWERTRDLKIPLVVQLYNRHLPRLQRVAERFPEIPIAIDHMANAQEEPGRGPSPELLAFGALPNAYSKFSTVNLYDVQKKGVAVADYFGPILERFGPERLMWGSNYPNTSDRPYAEMVQLARDAFAYLPAGQRDALLGGAALKLWPDLAARAHA
jgi:predicted TIM-barrel fold metal-dependent hydrolase